MAELLLAGVTLLLVAATLWLVLESRRQRVEANVIAWAAPWDLAGGLYLALQVENAGPAVARDVSVTWRLEAVSLPKGHLTEPVMSVGFRRTMLPTRDNTLDQLAGQAVPITLALTWRDGRRGVQKQTVRSRLRSISSGAIV